MAKFKRINGTVLERFEGKIVQDGDCWHWTGNLNLGYGRIAINRKPTYAHRWSYEYHIGPIPDGLVLDHLCRNRWCVNPYHLDPVPIAVNVSRGDWGNQYTTRKRVAS